MDPVSIIVSALAFGAGAIATQGLGKIGEDLYLLFKGKLNERFAANEDIQQAVSKVVAKPEMGSRQKFLEGELHEEEIALNDEIVQLAEQLLRHLKDQNLIDAEKCQALLQGSGAIAQKGGVAAGAGGIAIGGNLIYQTGPTDSEIVTEDKGTKDADLALRRYREFVRDHCCQTSLRGLDVGASDPTGKQEKFDLDKIYVDLGTTTQVTKKYKDQEPDPEEVFLAERESETLGALDAVVINPRLVLLGDPGSGKSTFLTHLAFCLADYGIDHHEARLQSVPGWPKEEADMVPILIVLRDFANGIPKDATKGTTQHIWKFFLSQLKAQNLSVAAKPLEQCLDDGRALVLFDGLDEIPSQIHRTFIQDAITGFAKRYAECRVVVTCRTLSYQEAVWQLPKFHSLTLAPFSKKQIIEFISAWYGQLARLGSIKPGAVKNVSTQLQQALNRPELAQLATNPLLLTVMALVHTHKGRLPEARALLYEDTIDLLLWRWEQIKVSEDESAHRLRVLLSQAGRTDVDLKRMLWRLAFEVHKKGKSLESQGVADIQESRLQSLLIKLHPDESRDWAHEIIELMKLRAGLLIERMPAIYAFPHRTFQEYLAGAYLSTEPDFPQQAARLIREGTQWREVVLLAVGRLVFLNGETAKPITLIGELCPAQENDTEISWRQVWLAGDVMVEMGLSRVQESTLGRELVERVRHRLVALIRKSSLSPVERAAAGGTLAKLGDPRKEVTETEHLELIDIPQGPFTMGEGKEAFQCPIPYDYKISKYPITNAQFQEFVKAGGYYKENYWKEAVAAGYWAQGKFKGEYDDEPWEGPLALQDPFGLDNHPVVGVSWYEALAFTQWLTVRLQEAGKIPKDWKVTLPNEPEWERAARGTDGRNYPWGDDPDPNNVNFDKTGIGTTSAVGCFSQGESPDHLEEMSGNVWEWTRSVYLREPYPPEKEEWVKRGRLKSKGFRVLRGGAFFNPDHNLRCSFRRRGRPGVRGRGGGFRVVASPFSSP